MRTNTPIYHPKYILIWMIYILFHIIGRLPVKIRTHLGTSLGTISYKLLKKKTTLAKNNIHLCFPEKNDAEVEKMCKKHFQYLGKAVINCSLSYTNPKKQLPLNIKGIEHIQEALKKGNGALLTYAHFTHLELGIKLIKQALPNISIADVYTPAQNQALNHIIKKARSQYLELIPKKNPRDILKALKQNKLVIFLPDQYLRTHKKHITLPFLGHKKKILSTMSTFAKLSNTQVIPTELIEKESNQYEIIFHPKLDNFPSENITEDTKKIANFIENCIKKNPETYMWAINQFNLD